MTSTVLAIDTSTARISVAFGTAAAAARELHAGELLGSQAHGEHLAVLVRELQQGAVPELVVVGLGPGPYTGLRVGIVTGEMLAEVWGVPVVGVSSLAAIAHGFRRRGGGECVAVMDVKRREIAWQQFDAAGVPVTEPAICSINELDSLPAGVPLAGPAFESQRLVSPVVADNSPVSAVDLIALATSGSTSLEPLYLRQPDAAEPKPRKQVSGD